LLGRFLEFSVETPDIPASLEFYGKIGFSQAKVGDAWDHPYAVVTDGRICVGLHQQAPATPILTFVRPHLLKMVAELESNGVELQVRRLGDTVFNEIAFLDPSGVMVRLIEARSFSPSHRKATTTSICGYFEEIGIPTRDLEGAKAFWENAGFVGMDEPDFRLPHVSCTSDFVDIGLYDHQHLAQPTLIFDADDIHTRISKLAAAGIEAAKDLPAVLRGTPAALFVAPEGTRVLLRGSTDR
jgi:catechol 2,3-dioxygenase-like lactoylglutathione lyase family enzyme/predicted enzyme related to lactoylglutathione lyase